MNNGSLTVVGTGIQQIAHLTAQARGHIVSADQLFFVIPGKVGAAWLKSLNPNATSLQPLYQQHTRRLDTYHAMVETVLAAVRAGKRVCAVFYGHPGVFVTPSHKMIATARAEGFAAQMLAGVSAEDCLFADLGFDPAQDGCLTYEATDFLVFERLFHPASHLILWQIGVVGNLGMAESADFQIGLNLILQRLIPAYGADHRVTVYEAAQYPTVAPLIHHTPLVDLPHAPLSPISTLYVPPKGQAIANLTVMAQLGIQAQALFA